MKIQTLNLKAGIAHKIGRGRFVRLLNAPFAVNIETTALGQKSNQHGQLLANTGAEYYQFESAFITSDRDQTVVLAYSELPMFDNRLGVDGALIVETVARGAAEVQIDSVDVGAERVPVLAADLRRRTALINTEGPVMLFNSAENGTGFEIDGVLEHPSTAGLWAEAESAVAVSVMEYLN